MKIKREKTWANPLFQLLLVKKKVDMIGIIAQSIAFFSIRSYEHTKDITFFRFLGGREFHFSFTPLGYTP